MCFKVLRKSRYMYMFNTLDTYNMSAHLTVFISN